MTTPRPFIQSEQVIRVILCLALMSVVIAGYQVFSLKSALLPPIEKPRITLHTSWQGKGADEIEQTLVTPLEQQLRSLNGLNRIESVVSESFAATELFFHPGSDLDQLYLEVLSQINQVPNWPTQVLPPRVINQSSGANLTLASAMLYGEQMHTKQDYIHVMEKIIEPALAKVQGVARIETGFNSTEQRIDIRFQPQQLTQLGLTTQDIAAALTALKDQSGGQMVIGSHDYSLHFNGQVPLEELGNVNVAVRQGHVIQLHEIAKIVRRPASPWGYAAFKGKRAFYFTLEPGANIDSLATMAEVKAVFEQLNDDVLPRYGMQLSLSRDDAKSINSALLQVYGNLLLGIALAGMMLVLFFGDLRSVGLIMLAVPVCLSLVILGMKIGDFSLNVISLAGMALSTGLLLDAAIIVIENINRHLASGKAVHMAIAQGTREVRGAIVSSTLSSILVFIPMVMMESVEAQLFVDLAFTVSNALLASVIVALVVLPAVARYFLRQRPVLKATRKDVNVRWHSAPIHHTGVRHGVLFLGLPLAVVLSVMWLPDFDVLPSPKQQKVNAVVVFEAPLSSQAAELQIAQKIQARLLHAQQTKLAPEYGAYGMFCSTQLCQLYFYPGDDWDMSRFRSWLKTDILADLPGTVSYVMQAKLLNFALPDNRTIELQLSGAALPELQSMGKTLMSQLRSLYPLAKITEKSPLSNHMTRIEFTVRPNALARLGLTRATLNDYLVTLTDGLYLGHYYTQGASLPMYLSGEQVKDVDSLLNTAILVPDHGLVYLHQLVTTQMVQVPSEWLRVNGDQAVALAIEPPEGVAVGPFVEKMKASVQAQLNQLDPQQTVLVSFQGSADNLSIFLREFLLLILCALAVLSVLLWLTLKSWQLALAVLMSLPMALFGGVLALNGVDIVYGQSLDMITMIGFIILLGLVINNAILIAEQVRIGRANGLAQAQAIVCAIKNRRRPIYMSTGTSILGMLPLLLSPAEGAEIYRGLGAVIVGGMTINAILGMQFMAALLSTPWFANANIDKPANQIKQAVQQ
ncbi:efflux RND transporter permease subunit [Pseudoalteromonas obscura]|uniref:Efflux RND transporter permease subunit n=1 Tax=Pseudoalteromonas obscura TaxID=3048491 RepID=A0ABT7ERY8_9GAMM|nr:efflux RND transporter permease subunit [Pseudoalteromonas sp. P94(2023)]MDK2597783.1 efflux RND transporter permease subunit [Pseudoalteromonas sp. P94(2023)]